MLELAPLLLACSLHFDDSLLIGVAEAFSAGNPFVIVDVALSSGQDDHAIGNTPSDRTAAETELARVLALGGEPVVGILPLRIAWLGEFGRPAAAAFEPCVAVEVASAKLSEFDYLCRKRAARSDAPERRACVLDRYGASLSLPGLRPWVMAILSLGAPPKSVQPAHDDAEPSLLHRPGGIFYPGEPQ